MKLSDMTKEVRALAVNFKANNKALRVNVEYYPHRLNVPLYLQIRDEFTDHQKTVSYLSELLKSWDIEDDDGNIIPTTREALESEKIPYLFLQLLLESIWVDMSGMRQELRESKNA